MYKKIFVIVILLLTTALPVLAENHKAKHKQGSPFASMIDSAGMKTIIVSPRLHAWAAYDEEGVFIRWGRASTGKDYCPDIGKRCRTPAGKYMIYEKRDAGCFSSKFPIPYGGAPMPFCMFFHGGYALHASNDVPANYNASHGCVRMFYDDARWLNRTFIDMPSAKGFPGTTVIVQPY